jgi:hypothetical protein
MLVALVVLAEFSDVLEQVGLEEQLALRHRVQGDLLVVWSILTKDDPLAAADAADTYRRPHLDLAIRLESFDTAKRVGTISHGFGTFR